MSVSNNYIQKSWSEQEVEVLFRQTIIETIRTISADNKNRYREDNIEQLFRGMHYANEHFLALSKYPHNKLATDLKNNFTEAGFYYDYYTSVCIPGNTFERLSSPNSDSGILPNTFCIRKGVTPSDALDQFMEGLTLTDCGNTCDVANYVGLRSLWGAEKFNYIFNAQGPTPLLINFNHPKNPLRKFRSLPSIDQKGDYVYPNFPENYT